MTHLRWVARAHFSVSLAAEGTGAVRWPSVRIAAFGGLGGGTLCSGS